MRIAPPTARIADALWVGENSFDNIHQRYRQPVYANIWKLVKHPEAAEDILQEVFTALWENRHIFSTESGMCGWLFVVSYNKAASYLKKKLREAAVLDTETDPADLFLADDQTDDEQYNEQWTLLQEAVAHLPARKQTVFRLCRFESKSVEEVAASTGISMASVKDYLKQSTRFVREYVRTRPRTASAVAVLLMLPLS